ncbi:excisionase family DNA-binding protein [Rathayibacter sp. AY1C5]|uniref:excisionase family DNA-binding protein n=1 Tax=Rathayibacter sp. AY1C5 TaxID=2080538 RepID=UPI000CE73A83|nr:excisionase family DNA-binding protein [Rathayibacter sp. AY1C5]PPG57579.1 DNA-binding protein [Rathayibacter sp. AY1C5]
MPEPLNSAEKRALLEEPTITVTQAARVLGRGRGQTYEDVAAGRIESIRLGRSILVPTAPLRRLLGIES